jgi:hypothetical protein
MKAITISNVRKLMGARCDPAVSIYLSTDPRRPGAPEDRARLRDLLRRASELLAGGYRREQIDALLVPIAERAGGAWPRARGVGFLRSAGVNASFALPVEVPDLAVVAPTFHVKPLLEVLDGHRRFFMLVLAERAARLLDGSGVVDVALEAPPAAAKDGPAPLEVVDEAVCEVLRDIAAPLVLAGPERLRRAYRAASRYGWLLPEELEADVEQVRATDLLPEAAQLVTQYREAVEQEAVAQFLAAETAGRATDDLERVARAATAGTVRLLLHRAGAHVWGRLDPVSGSCFVRGGQQQAGDADIIDDLCELTLLSGGDVVEVAPERMPLDAQVAAVVAEVPLLDPWSGRSDADAAA